MIECDGAEEDLCDTAFFWRINTSAGSSSDSFVLLVTPTSFLHNQILFAEPHEGWLWLYRLYTLEKPWQRHTMEKTATSTGTQSILHQSISNMYRTEVGRARERFWSLSQNLKTSSQADFSLKCVPLQSEFWFSRQPRFQWTAVCGTQWAADVFPVHPSECSSKESPNSSKALTLWEEEDRVRVNAAWTPGSVFFFSLWGRRNWIRRSSWYWVSWSCPHCAASAPGLLSHGECAPHWTELSWGTAGHSLCPHLENTKRTNSASIPWGNASCPPPFMPQL